MRSYTGTEIRRYWGKANSELGELAFHPLVFHSLDVAAVMHETLKRRPELLAWFANALNTTPEIALRQLTWIACVHDLGKFAENFQFLRADLAGAAGLEKKVSIRRHDVIGFAIWEKALQDPQSAWHKRLALSTKFQRPDWWLNFLHASTAHHGFPSEANAHAMMRNEISEASETAALDFAEWAFEHFSLNQPTANGKVQRAAASSAGWLLSGLVIYADWLGSNTDWFKYEYQSELSLERYWVELALPRAQDAITASRSAPAMIAGIDPRSAVGLDSFMPRPAQQLALDLPLPAGPQCFVIEDATGSGKTEAALILALRLMQNGSANGLYFALPTMATANGLLPRLQAIAEKFFDHPELAALALAHGGAQWVDGFSRRSNQAQPDVDDGALTASLRASSWINDHRKRALIAQIGVGTIDQALLAVLKAKHSGVRLFGLFGKVLIIDEVHAYDSYQFGLIKALLKAHRAQHGSAILLSATLPQAQRLKLLSVYLPEAQDDHDPDKPVNLAVPSAPYPLLSHASAELHTHAMAQIPGLLKHYRIRYLADQAEVLQIVMNTARQGQCVAWIRNTVSDAMAAFKLITEAIKSLPGAAAIQVRLFHARFTFSDRIRIEKQVLDQFGKYADPAKRSGQIVIATQVIEQSLDLDFDELITDLAPIDLMIQRGGRLRRHLRGAHAILRTDAQPDARGPAVLTVFGPDRSLPSEAVAKDWYAKFSRGAAMVYPHHGQIWQSAQALGNELDLFHDARGAIEAVYASEIWPKNLDDGVYRAIGNMFANAGQARDNTVNLDDVFQRQSDWFDDERAPTRLGDQTVEIALAVLRGTYIEPIDETGKSMAERWALSVVRVRMDFFGFESPKNKQDPLFRRVKLPNAALEAQASTFEKSPMLKWRNLVVLQESRAVVCSSKKSVELRYSDLAGLEKVKPTS